VDPSNRPPNVNSASTDRTPEPSRAVGLIAVGGLVVGLALTAVRIAKDYQSPGKFDWQSHGYCDFHNGVYYPAVAMARGENPYSAEFAQDWPVDRQIPFFSPLIVALHTPLAWLPLRAAEVVYFLVTVAALGWLAWLALKSAGQRPAWSALAVILAALVFSRPGQTTLFTGYFTAWLAIGSILALQFGRTRPALAGLGVALASGKPTYAIPLAIVMASRGHWRALIIGVILSAIGLVGGLAWLAHHSSWAEVLESIRTTQQLHHDQPSELPEHSWTRVDLVSVIARWTAWAPDDTTQLLWMAAILVLPCAVLWRRRHTTDDEGAGGLSGGLGALAILVALYHAVYDALLLVPLTTALIAGRPRVWREIPRTLRWLLVGLIMIPMFNYASSHMVLARLTLDETAWKVVTSLNGVCLLAALTLVTVLSLRRDRAEQVLSPAS